MRQYILAHPFLDEAPLLGESENEISFQIQIRFNNRVEKLGSRLTVVYHITIQEDVCVGCGNCATACPATTSRKIRPVSVEEGSEEPILRIEYGSAKLVDEEGCQLCGVCIGACPTGAIDIAEEEA